MITKMIAEVGSQFEKFVEYSSDKTIEDFDLRIYEFAKRCGIIEATKGTWIVVNQTTNTSIEVCTVVNGNNVRMIVAYANRYVRTTHCQIYINDCYFTTNAAAIRMMHQIVENL